jgi:hypothetical protein
MAVLNFSITIPDAQAQRVAIAVKAYLGDHNLSDADAIEGLRQEFISRLKNIVAATERAAALAAAETATYDVDAT